jgi:hypothetical protein
MNKITVSVCTMAIVGMGAGVGVAADPMVEKEAKPKLAALWSVLIYRPMVLLFPAL